MQRRRRLQGLAAHEQLKQRPAPTRRLTSVEPDLDGARGFEFDDTEAFDRTEDRRETESAPLLDDDSARRAGRGADPAVEEREGWTWCAADDGTGPPAFADATSELESIDIVDIGIGEWF
jgi:hypothetical protein